MSTAYGLAVQGSFSEEMMMMMMMMTRHTFHAALLALFVAGSANEIRSSLAAAPWPAVFPWLIPGPLSPRRSLAAP